MTLSLGMWIYWVWHSQICFRYVSGGGEIILAFSISSLWQKRWVHVSEKKVCPSMYISENWEVLIRGMMQVNPGWFWDDLSRLVCRRRILRGIVASLRLPTGSFHCQTMHFWRQQQQQKKKAWQQKIFDNFDNEQYSFGSVDICWNFTQNSDKPFPKLRDVTCNSIMNTAVSLQEKIPCNSLGYAIQPTVSWWVTFNAWDPQPLLTQHSTRPLSSQGVQHRQSTRCSVNHKNWELSLSLSLLSIISISRIDVGHAKSVARCCKAKTGKNIKICVEFQHVPMHERCRSMWFFKWKHKIGSSIIKFAV